MESILEVGEVDLVLPMMVVEQPWQLQNMEVDCQYLAAVVVAAVGNSF